MQAFFNSAYQFFYGTFQRWNDFLMSLDRDEKQVAPSDYVFPRRDAGVHAPFTVFQEDGFQYNLGDKKIQFTGNESADIWIQDFAILNIDIFHLIRNEQTLPDLQFVKRRYHLLAKQFHPDKSKQTNSQESTILLNNAYQSISEHLYEEVSEQANLFHSVFNTVLAKAQAQVEQAQTRANINNTSNTAPFIVLYLVGAGVGMVLVLKNFTKKKQ